MNNTAVVAVLAVVFLYGIMRLAFYTRAKANRGDRTGVIIGVILSGLIGGFGSLMAYAILYQNN